jgi:hypothetical protein
VHGRSLALCALAKDEGGNTAVAIAAAAAATTNCLIIFIGF